MSNHDPDVNSWSQPSLFPVIATELTLRVGIVQTAFHAQVQVEGRDVLSGTVTSLWSKHHVGLDKLPEAIADAVVELSRLAWDASDPFP